MVDRMGAGYGSPQRSTANVRFDLTGDALSENAPQESLLVPSHRGAPVEHERTPSLAASTSPQ